MTNHLDPATLALAVRGVAHQLSFRDVETSAAHVNLHTHLIPHADLVLGANDVETYLNTARETVRMGDGRAPVLRQSGDTAISFTRGRGVATVAVALDNRVWFEAFQQARPPRVPKPLEPLLVRAESILAQLPSAPSESQAPLVLQFGYDIGEIGRALTLHPDAAPAVAAFIQRTAPLLQRDTPLFRWIGRVYDAVDSIGSDTEVDMYGLGMRSDLEFFRDLYRDSVAADYVAGIELQDTDELLESGGADLYLPEIPAGYPASHVWWRVSQSGT